MDCPNETCKLRFENQENRISFIERKTENYAVMEERIKNIDSKVDRIDSKLNQILEKPSKRWDLVLTTIITGIVSSGLAFVVAQMMNK